MLGGSVCVYGCGVCSSWVRFYRGHRFFRRGNVKDGDSILRKISGEHCSKKSKVLSVNAVALSKVPTRAAITDLLICLNK